MIIDQQRFTQMGAIFILNFMQPTYYVIHNSQWYLKRHKQTWPYAHALLLVAQVSVAETFWEAYAEVLWAVQLFFLATLLVVAAVVASSSQVVVHAHDTRLVLVIVHTKLARDIFNASIAFYKFKSCCCCSCCWYDTSQKVVNLYK